MSNSNLTSIRRALKEVEASLKNVEEGLENVEEGLEKAGAGGNIYGHDGESTEFLAYADEQLTTPLTYQEGKRLLMGGAGLVVVSPEDQNFVRIAASRVYFNDSDKVADFNCVFMGGSGVTEMKYTVLFSDTPTMDS